VVVEEPLQTWVQANERFGFASAREKNSVERNKTICDTTRRDEERQYASLVPKQASSSQQKREKRATDAFLFYCISSLEK